MGAGELVVLCGGGLVWRIPVLVALSEPLIDPTNHLNHRSDRGVDVAEEIYLSTSTLNVGRSI